MHFFKNKFIFILIFLFCFYYLLAEDTKTTNAKSTICIIYAKSKYKLALTEAIEKKLYKENISVVKDELKNINKYNPSDYKVIIILSGVAIFTPYPQATSYIKKHNYAKNIIYFCAAYVESTIYGFLDGDRIDAITAASEEDNIEETADEIVKKVFEIIGTLGI